MDNFAAQIRVVRAGLESSTFTAEQNDVVELIYFEDESNE